MSPIERYWRSLQELEFPEALEESLHREFPAGASEFSGKWSRREFLRLMGASIALAGAAGCTRQPLQKIVPYIKQPEEMVPGRPQYYATALTLGGYARGVLVQTHEGRPTKIEGNPSHPASLGASDVFMQAELLSLYDPERSRAAVSNGQISTWNAFTGELAQAAQRWGANRGRGLRLLTQHETSPTLLDQLKRLLLKYPEARWCEYEPVENSSAATRFHFDRAEVIVSIDSDFLASGPASLLHAREFAETRRRLEGMSRLYVIEPTPSLTGAMADHRFVMNPEQIVAFARELVSGAGSKAATIIGAELRRNRGKGLLIAGQYQPAEVHEAVDRLNVELGNIGATVEYFPPTIGRQIEELAGEISQGGVDSLLIIGGNPVYDAPADLGFAKLLTKVPNSFHIGLYQNETAALCRWHLPEAHSLESWSDARAFDGTASIIQPVIEPLFAGRSRHELLAQLLGEPPATSYDIVRAFWSIQHAGSDFEQFWRKSLHEGTVAVPPPPTPSTPIQSSRPSNSPRSSQKGRLHLLIRPSSQLYDGRFSNNAWLQEFPDPLTKLVWDNAALLSPATAAKLNLGNGALVNLKSRGRSVQAPIWILPGQADDCVTVHLGYGRTRAGSVGEGVGFSAYELRTSDAMWGGPGLELEPTGQSYPLVTTQHHWSMEGRGLVRVGTLAQFRADPESVVKTDEPPPGTKETLYPPKLADAAPAWAMAIDLNTCIGCGACTIACQAENNIPVVGKEQVANNREMHWIRVDRYYQGDPANPETLHQPVPCMHCENAPCELVCPVAATVHSQDGLNQMVYNRCIGTRYCSNNCPYKVRRFNFLEYDENRFENPETRKLGRNPNVTVRSRGVMEKCTYCIQRIQAVKIEARKTNRPIREGEIIPACAQACPADAIIFGDRSNAGSRVAKLKQSPLNYGLLAELNTRPRTTYLARLRNPNPDIK